MTALSRLYRRLRSRFRWPCVQTRRYSLKILELGNVSKLHIYISSSFVFVLTGRSIMDSVEVFLLVKTKREKEKEEWNIKSGMMNPSIPPPLFFIDFIFSHQQQQRLTLVCQSQTIWCQEKRKKSFSPGPPFQINTHRKQSSKKEEDGCNVISFVSRWCRVYVSWNVSPESCFSWFNHTLEEVGLISSSFRHLARKQTISFLFSFLPFSSCSRMFLPSDTWFWHWTIRYAKRIPPNNKVEIQYEKSLFI